MTPKQLFISMDIIENVYQRTLLNVLDSTLIKYDADGTSAFWSEFDYTLKHRLNGVIHYYNRLFKNDAPIMLRVIITLNNISIYQVIPFSDITIPFNFRETKLSCLCDDLSKLIEAADEGSLYDSLILGEVNPSMILPSKWDYILNTATDSQKETLQYIKNPVVFGGEIKYNDDSKELKPYYDSVRIVSDIHGLEPYVDRQRITKYVASYLKELLKYYDDTSKDDTLEMHFSVYGKEYNENYSLTDLNCTVNNITLDICKFVLYCRLREKNSFDSAINKMKG